MAATTLDTLKFARTLRDKAKLSNEQAEGISEAFAEATSQQIVTKADLKEELAPVRTEMTLTRWMLGFMLAMQVAILMKLFFR